MRHKTKLFFLGVCAMLFSCNSNETKAKKIQEKPSKPNIVVFYVDDLGYGDLGSYGAVGVETPNVDRLAHEGIKFTDAHSSSATCTPSRYSLLTGNYAFRNNAAVLKGDAPLIIDKNIETLPDMLKKGGYKTGVVGKWHLGLGDGNVDWNKEIKPGPLEIGFDYSFLIPSTGDRVPSVYVENHKVVNNSDENDPIKVSYVSKFGDMPDGINNPELLRQKADVQHSGTIVNGISRIGFMDGGTPALWTDEDFPDVLTDKAISFIEGAKSDPFFLFFSFHDIHVPRLPNKKFQGKSTMGPRGDAIVQMDWMTGEVMNALEKLNLLENTLVIFTSDNGPVLNDGYEDLAEEKLGNHKPSGIYRGGKYSAYEAGTRMPTLAFWKGKIMPGISNALWSQVDLYASLADLIKQPITDNAAIDSQNILPVLLSSQEKEGREYLLEESYTLSLRKGNWKYIDPFPEEKTIPDFIEKVKNIEGGHMYSPQLYNLEEDPSEKNNLATQYPEKVAELKSELEKIKNKKS
ncbi:MULTISPECIES: sulfatase-like hydrolase/transferase [Aquimarina]|uniref:Sulfatase-like hydrolase/transferase n=1 Tax=Aquimarina algiphila TaxID=2047982 RepID=A0A554VQI3_9FLAO|nr:MULTISPECIES: sulfatase-like hydrolase/transferase [Aquimarina]TSE10779.1 sulfatase-like hydrolase/transferase [Aquimarina algiphila]